MVVTLLHVFLKVLSEVEQGFLYLALKLVMKTKEEMAIRRSWAVIPGSSAEQSSGQRGDNTHTAAKGNVIQQHFSSPREL